MKRSFPKGTKDLSEVNFVKTDDKKSFQNCGKKKHDNFALIVTAIDCTHLFDLIFQAFLNVERRNGPEYQPALEGFTPHEMFFINYAQVTIKKTLLFRFFENCTGKELVITEKNS